MMRLCFLIAAIVIAAQPVRGETRSVWIDDLTWPEVRDAIAAGKRTAIVYTGSSEQNGPHMVIGKHNFVAHYEAQRIAEELGDALVYPILPFAVTGNAAARTGHEPVVGIELNGLIVDAHTGRADHRGRRRLGTAATVRSRIPL